MRHRFIALFTAGALVISSLVLGTFAAQADDDTSEAIVQADEASTPPGEADSTPAAEAEESTVVVEDVTPAAEPEDTSAPVAEAEDTSTPEAADDSTPSAQLDDTTPAPDDSTAQSDETSTPAAHVTQASSPVIPLDAPIVPVVQAADVTATISGNVTPGNATDITVNVCDVQGDSSYYWINTCSPVDVDSSGAYTTTVTPGTTVAVYASADGYMASYLGGYASSIYYPDANTATITKIAIPAAGGTFTGKNITLTKPTSISGTISLPPGYAISPDSYYYGYSAVTAYEVVTSNGSTSLTYAGYSSLDSTRKYVVDNLIPGHQYVMVANLDNYTITPSNDLVTTVYGGYAPSDYIYNWDLSDPGIKAITADPAGVTGKDITMKMGAIIKGTVSPANVSNEQAVVCYVRNQTLSDCSYLAVGSDGSYSQLVAPGASVVVYAVADGYFYTYPSGLSSTSDPHYRYYLDSSVTPITASPNGGITSVGTIKLMKASSISGKVLLTDGYDLTYANVTAYQIDTSSGTPEIGDAYSTSVSSSNETYTIDNLMPGEQYLVVVDSSSLTATPSNDFVTTAHGGYASNDYLSDWDLTQPLIADNLVSLTTNPATADIKMVKGDFVSGTITPANAESISVYVCEVTGSGDNQSTQTCHWVPTDSNGFYSANVSLGATVVVKATADGYLYTWLGDYVAGSDTYQVNDQMTQIQAPATDVNITLQKAVAISGTINLPPGYGWTSDDFNNFYMVEAYEVVTSNGSQYLSYGGSSPIDSNGKYTINDLIPGHQYVIIADSSSLTFTPSNDLITTAYGGYASTDYYGYWDLSNPGITPVTPGSVDMTGKDITMKMASVIKGTITPANAPNEEVSVCEVRTYTDSNDQYLTNCSNPTIGTDGSFSQPVNPGATVAVYGVADGYFYSWLGGFTSSSYYGYDLTDPTIAQKSTDAKGGIVQVGTLTLKQASSISGKISVQSGYDLSSTRVRAYEIDTSSGTAQVGDLAYGYSDPSSNNTYTIDKLTPGKQYLVVVDSNELSVSPTNDFLNTAHGGYASMDYANSWDLTQPDIVKGLVSLTTAPATGIDIAMVKGDVISGTITPADAQNLEAQVCEVTGSGDDQSVGNCSPATIDNNGFYSATVTPGATVVVWAKADDYLYTFFGEYATSSPYASLTDQAKRISGSATDRDIELLKATSISGTIRLPQEYAWTNDDFNNSNFVDAYEVVTSNGSPSMTWAGSSSIDSNGNYTVGNLTPGRQYVIIADPTYLSFTPSNDFMATSYGGYASMGNWDLSDPGMVRVTADPAGVTGKDIELKMGAVIKGKISPADAPNEEIRVCEVRTYSNSDYQYLDNCKYPTIGTDGSYSQVVTPGATVVVYGVADGYFYTYPSGASSSDSPYSFNASLMTPITTSVDGGITEDENSTYITLAKASSISGKVIVPSGYDLNYAYVRAYEVDASGTTLTDNSWSASTGSNGTYTIDKLTPGKQYLVAVDYDDLYFYTANNDFMTTDHGGYSAMSYVGGWDLTQPDTAKGLVTLTTTPATGVDITMKQGDVISGTITPTDAQAISVQVCELTGTGANQSVNTCRSASIKSNGQYSATVTPGATVVVQAYANGYLYTWLGDYATATYDTYTLNDQMTRVQASTGNDIKLQQAGSIYGKVIIPDEYTFYNNNNYNSSVQAYEVAPDGTVSNSATAGAYVANNGSYTLGRLNPGAQYRITVQAPLLSINPSNDFITTDHDGLVTATVAGTKADIPLTMGAIIKGTVTPLDATAVTVQVCEVTSSPGSSYLWTTNCQPRYIGNGGPYSVAVTPGVTAVVYATADGYLTTYVGGYADSSSANNVASDSITKIQTSAQGGTTDNQNINLQKAGSISGSVILPDGYTFTEGSGGPNQVLAYPIDSTSGTPQISGSTGYGYFGGYMGPVSGSTGAYTIDNLVPGKEYLVVVNPSSIRINQTNDLLQTSAGGYASMNYVSTWDLTRDDLGLATATVDGTPNVDITMVKGATVSGTITPQDAKNIQVWVCQVQPGGSSQYLNNCRNATMNGNAYSAAFDPGMSVAVQAKADDYLYTWLGTYSDTSDMTYSNVQDGMTVVQAPATKQDIDLKKAAIISGTVTLPDGYKLSNQYTSSIYATEVVQTENGPTLGNQVYGTISTDGTYRIAVKPGSTYIVSVAPYNLNLSQGNASDLLTTAYGTYLTEGGGLYNADLTDPTIQTVTMTADQPNVNLTMVAGAKITGTVYLPDGTPVSTDDYVTAYANCIVASSYSGRNSNYVSASGAVGNDGSYSCTVIPGRQYIVYAYLNGGQTTNYPTTWVGGFIGSNPTLPNGKVTQVTAPDTKQDIYLSAGSSISGTLLGYVPDPDNPYAEVDACMLNPDGSMTDCRYTNTIDADGTYTITGLVPGANTVVNAYANGYMTTYYGGYAGSNPPLPNNDKVTEFTSATAGGNVPNVNITLVKPVTVTGSIIPNSVISDNGGLYVYACPVYTQNGQSYYRTAAPMIGRGSATLNNNTSASVEQWCTIDWIPASETSYTLQIPPNMDYAIVAQADGYADAWYGGYLADSGVTYEFDSLSDASGDRVLPSSNQIQLVSGTPGQTLEGKDLIFGESVSVTFDSDGGTPATTSKSTTPGGTVILPANPTRTGYTFGGWYTAKNGAGTQFLATTAVPKDLTVYAKWTEIPTYTVTFVDGVGNTIVAKTVYKGTAVVAPGNPTRDGFTFAGWDKPYTNVTSDLTVTALWIANAQAVTVTFDSQGGSVVNPSTTDKGKTVVLPTPTREHFVFDGWFTAATGGTQVTSPMTANDNVTLYARWTPVATYTLKYDANLGSGSMPSATYYDQDTATVANNDFVRIGYSFVSWNTAADKSGTTYVPGASLTMTGDVTLYAQWQLGQVTTYQVMFVDGQGGTIVTRTVNEGTAAVAPDDPTRDGFVFAGWDTTYDNVTSDMTVTAKWVAVEKSVTVTFDPQDGSSMNPAVVEQGETVVLPTPTRDHYTFNGWFTQASGGTKVTSPLTVSDDVTLYAQWTQVPTYTVTFVDGSGNTITTTVDEGAAAVPPENPTKDGYTFAGWDTTFDDVTSNMTVTAKWVANEKAVTVTFDPQGGSSANPAVVEQGETVTLPTPTRDGYVFVGWFTQATGGTQITSSTEVTDNATVYAHWQAVVPTYTVTFNDGQGKVLSTVQVEQGTAATAPATPTRHGFVFDRWDVSFDKVTSNLTVTAIWNAATAYTLSYDANGGTGSMPSAGPYYSGDTVKLAPNSFTYDGKIFTGWNTAANGTGKAYPDASTLTITGNTTLFAQWRVPGMFTVTFTDGQGNMLAAVVVREGSAATPPADPTRDGYTFSGWDAAFNAVTSDVTVNAAWKANAPSEKPKAPTGGTAQHHGFLLLFAGGCVVAGVLSGRLRSLTPTKRG